ncbi:MAG: hypothetical protein K0R17_3891 [Rariglobus sp.]|jgi:hypothetical protein|nr:hypothetical protein [Rariglobus sp.]
MSHLLPIALRFDAGYKATPSVPLSPSIEFNERLTSLYALAQRSDYVFASPLGPFYQHARHAHVPRFVYFGPHTSDESLRLAFHAGFDARDLRGTLALLHFVERLALTPDLGQGLNLSFFPLADVTGLLRSETQDLASNSWIAPEVPELALLAGDARSRGYHGFVRIETTAMDDDVITVRLRGHSAGTLGVELLNSDDLAPWSVRWEAGLVNEPPVDGPLSLSDDLPFQPFELTLGLPAAWSVELHREAATAILKNFIIRYRGLHAYAQHL